MIFTNNNRNKKLITVVITATLLPTFFAFAQTTDSDLPSLIKKLEAQILELQSRVRNLKTELEEVKEELAFTKNLHKGEESEEVKNLQQFLSQFPDIYPEARITGFYGPLTEDAIKRFQAKHGIITSGDPTTTGYGLVGPKTRAKLNELAGSATTTPSTPSQKLTICHIPPGDPTNKHTLDIGQSALEAHLAHGDTVGACPAVPSIPPATTTSIAPSTTTPATPAILTPAVPGQQSGTSTTSAVPAVSAAPVTPVPPVIVTPLLTAVISTSTALISVVASGPPLKSPWDIVVSGNDYVVTDWTGDFVTGMTGRIFRITPGGSISTIILRSGGRFFGLLASGNDFITTHEGALMRVSAGGTLSTIASRVVSRGFPTGITAYGSDFVVTDYDGGRLLRVTPSGAISVIASGLRNISSVAYDGTNFIVVSIDSDGVNLSAVLRRVTPSGSASTIAKLPRNVNYHSVVMSGSDYIVNNGGLILHITPAGAITSLFDLSQGFLRQIVTIAVSGSYSGSYIIATDPSSPPGPNVIKYGPISFGAVTPVTPAILAQPPALITATSTASTLSAPTLKATLPTDGKSVTFTWNNVANEDIYRLYRRVEGGFDSVLAANLSADTITYTERPLLAVYEYYIEACTASGVCSPPSNVVKVNLLTATVAATTPTTPTTTTTTTATTTASIGTTTTTTTATTTAGTTAATATVTTTAVTIPSAPGGLSSGSVDSSGTVTLTWTDKSGDETRFEIQHATNSGGPYTKIGEVGSGTTRFSYGETVSGFHYYRVAACNSAGCSDWYNYPGMNFTITTPSSTSTTSTTSSAGSGTGLSAPQMTVTSGTTRVDIIWVDVAGETSYKVMRRKAGDVSYGMLADLPANTTSYSDPLDYTYFRTGTPAMFETTYEYTVQACATDCSPDTNRKSALVYPPKPVSNFSLQQPSSGTIALNWTNNSAIATQITVNRTSESISENSFLRPDRVIAYLAPSATSYVDTGLAPGTYNYYIGALANSKYAWTSSWGIYGNILSVTVSPNSASATTTLVTTSQTKLSSASRANLSSVITSLEGLLESFQKLLR